MQAGCTPILFSGFPIGEAYERRETILALSRGFGSFRSRVCWRVLACLLARSRSTRRSTISSSRNRSAAARTPPWRSWARWRHRWSVSPRSYSRSPWSSCSSPWVNSLRESSSASSRTSPVSSRSESSSALSHTQCWRSGKCKPRVEGVVPGVAVVVAFVLVIISIMVLVWYVHHIGRSLRVSALIELVGTDTRKLLDAIYADHGATPRFQRPTICAPRSGVITQIDHKALVRIAEAGDCVLTLLPALGEFVPAGAPLFEISGETEADRRERRNTLDSSSAWSVLSIKTWPMACECSSISPSGHCPTDRSLIRRRRCRRSIGCMIACVSSRRVLSRMVDIETRKARCAW